MNKELIILSILQFCLSISFGVIVIMVSFNVLRNWILKKHNIEVHNTSSAILMSSIIFSTSYFISYIGSLTIGATRFFMLQNQDLQFVIGKTILNSVVLMILSLVIIIIIIMLSLFLFNAFYPKINKYQDLEENNLATSILLATIIISITVLSKDSVWALLDTFVSIGS